MYVRIFTIDYMRTYACKYLLYIDMMTSYSFSCPYLCIVAKCNYIDRCMYILVSVFIQGRSDFSKVLLRASKKLLLDDYVRYTFTLGYNKLFSAKTDSQMYIDLTHSTSSKLMKCLFGQMHVGTYVQGLMLPRK